jgi:protein O-mannosyl-transferase
MKYILIIILGLVVYVNALSGSFVWDDQVIVRNNASLREWSAIPKIFTPDNSVGSSMRRVFWRPLQFFSYFLEHPLWGSNPAGYHFTNILLHILVALALYKFINIVFDNVSLAYLTSALFVTHPLHTEAVAYISGRGDLLAVLFMLVSFILYIGKRKSLHIPMMISYCLALLSKESALILPFMLLIYHYTLEEKPGKKFLYIAVPAAAYLLLRATILRAALPQDPWIATAPERIPGFFVAITNYIRLILLPFGLHMEYGDRLFSISDPRAIAGIAISAASLIYAFKARRRNRLVFFSISWFFAALLPSSNIYPLPFYMAEHYLYLSSVGFFILLAKGLLAVKRPRGAGTFLMISLLALYSIMTIAQNQYWKNDVTLFNRALKYEKSNARLYYNLGVTYYGLGQKDRAIEMFDKAIVCDGTFAYAYNKLGMAYRERNDNEKARILFLKAIALDPAFIQAYQNLCSLYVATGRVQEAIDLYKTSLAIKITLEQIYNAVGLMCHENGKEDEAIALFKKAIEANPGYAPGYNNLAVAYYYKGQYEPALGYCDKAKSLGYNNIPLEELLKPYRKGPEK